MKRFLALFLAILCLSTMLILPVSAADACTGETVSSVRIDLPDGGYIIEEVTVYKSAARATTVLTGDKTRIRYTGSGTALFAVTVSGTFKYTGSTSWATDSAATVTIYNSGVTYVSKSAFYAANHANATGNITYYGESDSLSVALYCDANGNLS